MRILITGGAGYLGSVLTPSLLRQGHAVTVLDSFFFRQNSLVDCCCYDAFDVVRGDCRDEAALKPLMAKADVVIPLAAMVGAPLCSRDTTAARTINLDAVRLICRLATDQQSILFPTTNSGYGFGEKDAPCTEESPLRPLSLYAVTKTEAEEAVLQRANSLTFRLATVFGMSPRMRLDLLVNDFVYRAVTDRAVVIFEGHFRRNFIHVRDVARVFLHGMENFAAMRGKPYNAGLDDANLSKIELCREIRNLVPGFTCIEAPVGEDPDKRDYIVSNARLAATGFRTEWPLSRGIRELIKGYAILRRGEFANV